MARDFIRKLISRFRALRQRAEEDCTSNSSLSTGETGALVNDVSSQRSVDSERIADDLHALDRSCENRFDDSNKSSELPVYTSNTSVVQSCCSLDSGWSTVTTLVALESDASLLEASRVKFVSGQKSIRVKELVRCFEAAADTSIKLRVDHEQGDERSPQKVQFEHEEGDFGATEVDVVVQLSLGTPQTLGEDPTHVDVANIIDSSGVDASFVTANELSSISDLLYVTGDAQIDDKDEEKKILALSAKIGYLFNDRGLLRAAMSPQTWKRMSMLGDSIPKTILADLWTRSTSSEYDSGHFYNHVFKPILENHALDRRGRLLGLDAFVIPDRPRGRTTASDIASMVEGILGATYIDSSSDWTRVYAVMRNLGIDIIGADSTQEGRDAINRTILCQHTAANLRRVKSLPAVKNKWPV